MLGLLRTGLANPALRLARAGSQMRGTLSSNMVARGPFTTTAFPVVDSLTHLTLKRKFASSTFALYSTTATKKKTATRGRAVVKKTTGAKKRSLSVKAKPKKRVAAKKKTAVKKVREKKPKLVKTTVLPAKLKPPKRAPSGYILFTQKFRNASTHPKKTLEDQVALIKQAADTWNSLNEFEKRPFLAESEALKITADRERAIWSEKVRGDMTLFNAINKNRKEKGKKRVKLLRPENRHPTTGFLLFHKSRIPEMTGTMIEKSKANGLAWRQMSDAEKKPFLDESKANVDRYNASRA